ncbi:MAG TPA: hypothetical protein VL126_04550, partial [Bacteroidota bacterium]|nr:hypothetical protein [Bacteroidota bacterium]
GFNFIAPYAVELGSRDLRQSSMSENKTGGQSKRNSDRMGMHAVAFGGVCDEVRERARRGPSSPF